MSVCVENLINISKFFFLIAYISDIYIFQTTYNQRENVTHYSSEYI